MAYGKPTPFRSLLAVAWIVVSTVAYATVTIAVACFSRRLAREIGRAWCRHLLAVAGVKIEVDGLDRLRPDRRYVFVSNHQSALDIPLIIGGLKHHVSFIAKRELFMIPFFGWGIYMLGHVWIDRSNARKARRSISRAVATLKREGISLIIFPEGTRSPDGRVREFKKGSFTLALESGVEVVPVAIEGTHRILPKKALAVRPGIARLYVTPPIPTEGLQRTDKAALAESSRARILKMLGGENTEDETVAVEEEA